MNKHNDLLDEYYEIGSMPKLRNITNPEQRQRHKSRTKSRKKPDRTILQSDLVEQVDGLDSFIFSYQASRHERQWLIDSLGSFHDAHWLEDVLRLLKGGKEASVYQCTSNPAVEIGSKYSAAKVYRPRRFRNLKNDHLYREGRARLDGDGIQIIDDRSLHAIRQRTSYGRRLMHTSWIEHEYQTMQILHAAGVDMPVPYTRGNNAILMEYIGDTDMPAPTLNMVDLEPDEAYNLFTQVMRNVHLMLEYERVHADLSAYNILYWDGAIKIIDFPQAINPHENRSAYLIFKRDIRRICDYFTHQGLRLDPSDIARQMWTSHGYPIRHEVNPALLDDQDEQDRQFWDRYRNA